MSSPFFIVKSGNMGHPHLQGREGSNKTMNVEIFGGTVNGYINIRNMNVDLILYIIRILQWRYYLC